MSQVKTVIFYNLEKCITEGKHTLNKLTLCFFSSLLRGSHGLYTEDLRILLEVPIAFGNEDLKNDQEPGS